MLVGAERKKKKTFYSPGTLFYSSGNLPGLHWSCLKPKEDRNNCKNELKKKVTIDKIYNSLQFPVNNKKQKNIWEETIWSLLITFFIPFCSNQHVFKGPTIYKIDFTKCSCPRGQSKMFSAIKCRDAAQRMKDEDVKLAKYGTFNVLSTLPVSSSSSTPSRTPRALCKPVC